MVARVPVTWSVRLTTTQRQLLPAIVMLAAFAAPEHRALRNVEGVLRLALDVGLRAIAHALKERANAVHKKRRRRR